MSENTWWGIIFSACRQRGGRTQRGANYAHIALRSLSLWIIAPRPAAGARSLKIKEAINMFGHIYTCMCIAPYGSSVDLQIVLGSGTKKRTLSVAARTFSGTEIIARAESRHKNDNEGSQMRRVIRLERRTPFNLALMMVIAARPRRHTPRKPLLYLCGVCEVIVKSGRISIIGRRIASALVGDDSNALGAARLIEKLSPAALDTEIARACIYMRLSWSRRDHLSFRPKVARRFCL